jgi:hypothetical protein
VADHVTDALADVTVQMYGIRTVGGLREFMNRIDKMPNEASIDFPSELAASVKATWQTRNPL